MWFEVLGPVRAWRGRVEVDLGSPQQRAVLAMLLLDVGRPVSVDRLVDGLWGDTPPRHASQVARTYVSRLRKILNVPGTLLFSEVSGYALRPDEDSFDLPVFEDALAVADEAQAGGDLERADRVLGAALALWRGEPLAGIAAPWAEAPRARLIEKRLTIREQRCRIRLELGRHAQEVAELMELCRAHPFRERLRELLMLALHRCGRTAEALGVYADTRKLFADELGIAPGHGLSALHDRILRDDSTLLVRTGVERAVICVPAQLPAGARDFTGRTEAVTALLAAVSGGGAAVVSGMGGVGKTALAVHVAQLVTAEFDGGQLYANLRGAAADPAEPASVLAAFLTALGVAETAIPRGLVERAALYRSMLAGQRVLVVLDDAHDAAQVHPLVPGSPDCAVLVTSRARRTVVDGAFPLHLDVMRRDEAVALLRAVVGAGRVDAEPAAADELIDACGLLPLSLRLVGARLAARPGWSVTDVVANLVGGQRIPGAEVEAVFELSYRQLTVDQAGAFRRLAVVDGPDFSLEAAVAILRIGNVETQELLESLVDASLLDSRAFGRYYYHDVTRAFAHLRLRGDETQSTLRRLLDFYLATACTAFELAVPGDPVTEIAAPPQCPGLPIPDAASARAWVVLDADNIVAAVCQAAAAVDRDWDAVRIAVDLLVVLCPYNHVIRYVRLEPAVMTLWQAVGAHPDLDPRVAGRIHFLLSMAHLGSGRPTLSEAAAYQSIRSCEAAGDTAICCQALNVLGRINRRRRRYEEALRHYRRTLELARAAGHRSIEAITMANLAAVLIDRGDPADAVLSCERALATATAVEDVNARIYAMHTLGIALHRCGRHQDAADMQGRCLQAAAETGLTRWQAHARFQLANALISLGCPAEAASHAEQALVLCRELSDQVAEAAALTSMADALAATGDVNRARACLRSAHRIFRDLSMPAAGDTLRRLRELGDPIDDGSEGARAELITED
ncbi:BTAD domain-containing putative transcriptional regulator [Nocardia sp. NPDC060256]|uniref:AfsR/SARP family transcriptional regulator n=1 Tax=unclassified Nocardia TaxID=2637762 RepID=UPI00365FAA14